MLYRHILIPTDGSALATEAVDKAMALAKDIGAKVTVLTVTVPLRILSADPDLIALTAAEYKWQASEQSRRIRTAAEEKAKALGVPCETHEVKHGHPYEAIIATAGQMGCDLIAMASHGRRGVSAVILGSETLKVLTHSKIPVLVPGITAG